MPPEEIPLILWVTELARTVLPKTIRAYLASVTRLAAECGFPAITREFHFLSRVLRGVELTTTLRPREQRKPITCAILRKVLPLMDTRRRDDAMLWAAMCLGTMGLLRGGEFALPNRSSVHSQRCLRISNVTFNAPRGDEPRVMFVQLYCTKTDKARRGVQVVLGASKTDVCAVSAMLWYLKLRGGTEATSTSSPLFVFSDGAVLTRSLLVKCVRNLLECAQIPTAGYSGHSFRIGGATDLARAGASDIAIQKAGRWTSDAFRLYVRVNISDAIQRSKLISSATDRSQKK